MEKYFTPKEATQTLPLVKKIVQDILAIGNSIHDLSRQIGSHPENDPRVVQFMEQLETLFEELEIIGCSYKDWNFTAGLVDFPAQINGKDVYLCWRSDEEGLLYYHEMDEGFSGRKLIPKELL